MRNASLLTLACAVSVSFAVAAADDNPFGAFRGKMKEGLYEYRMDMDMGAMPGMPPGMGKQTHTFQHCVTKDDIERGQVGRNGRERNTPENCKVEDFHMSGNTADYKMVCKGGPDMTAQNHVVFSGDGYKMDMKMAMNERGHVMNMTQHMEGRYLGPCKQ